MIGSFWNLCRACPSMPVDKLHSEYRSTYRWHEYTGPRQEVVRRPPQGTAIPAAGLPNEHSSKNAHDDDFQTDSLNKQEPAMPRRKKYPDLAYRHHEFLVNDGNAENGGNDRARILENGLLRKAISKISTEYRRQFAWPPGHSSRKDELDGAPKKSQSMGALKANAHAMVHKKRIDMENKDASELEPLVDDKTNHEKSKEEYKSEYKKTFRPFSRYEYISGRFTSKRPREQTDNVHKDFSTDLDNDSSWYREVVELRKKAGEYKHRGWGSELAPEKLSDIYNKQVELWDQVSRRSSLSALSLASHMTHKSYTKEEKEDNNNRKTSPTKAYRNAENNARMIRDIIRHHLERTTGGSEYDGLILSPTREKLEPTIPRKDDDSRGSQRNSPKKSSPMKSSSLKRASQKAKQARSQSVGPPSDAAVKDRSPKRQSRPTVKENRKSTSNTPSNKRPRPSPEQAKSEAIQQSEIKQTTIEEPDLTDYEPVVKSPPEPTRVKSPEQIIMRSPDPVNWTVPLDTGKTFTVTQNIREGDVGSRPHSEVKAAWTPPEVPLPVAQSAPPMLSEQMKEQP